MAEKNRTGRTIAQGLKVNGLMTGSAADGITAHAGGGQASAVPLAAMINRVATVATAGDSVALPPSQAGLSITVINAGANALSVFPNGTDLINALGLATAFSLAAGKVATFTCAGFGQWYSLLGA